MIHSYDDRLPLSPARRPPHAEVSSRGTANRRPDLLRRLTRRQLDVLELMAQGSDNAAIAERLYLTVRAVEKHVNGIFARLDIRQRPDMHPRVAAVLVYLGIPPSALLHLAA